MGYLSEQKKKMALIKKKNGVILKTMIPIEKNGVIIEWQKERVPDGDTLCWLRCGAKDECNAIVPARVN